MSLRDFATQPLHFQVFNTRKASSSLKVFYEHWVYKKQSISFPLFYRKMTGRFLFPLPSSGKMHTFFCHNLYPSWIWSLNLLCLLHWKRLQRGYVKRLQRIRLQQAPMKNISYLLFSSTAMSSPYAFTPQDPFKGKLLLTTYAAFLVGKRLMTAVLHRYHWWFVGL